MRILALDLSKNSSGWAYYERGADRPYHGCWTKIASEYTEERGQIFYQLYRELTNTFATMPFDRIYAEEPINHLPQAVQTNAESVRLHLGLASTVELFAYTKRCGAVRWVNMATWRRFFLGPTPKGEKRPKGFDLKFLAIRRCKELGFNPQKHDDAEALGILDYALDAEDIRVPWHDMEPVYKAARSRR